MTSGYERFEVHPGHIGIWGLSVANATASSGGHSNIAHIGTSEPQAVAAGMMLAASSGMLLEAVSSVSPVYKKRTDRVVRLTSTVGFWTGRSSPDFWQAPQTAEVSYWSR